MDDRSESAETIQTRRLRPLLAIVAVLVLIGGGFAAYRAIARGTEPDPERQTCQALEDLDAAIAEYADLVRSGGTSLAGGADLTVLRDLADRFSDVADRLIGLADRLEPRDGLIVAERVRMLAGQVREHAEGLNSLRGSNPVGVAVARSEVGASLSCSSRAAGSP